ncbi:MAG: hypothetical protein ACI82A_004226 [Candidatus Azotimanducaceae bacterium]|jgi:hypothetical protein
MLATATFWQKLLGWIEIIELGTHDPYFYIQEIQRREIETLKARVSSLETAD